MKAKPVKIKLMEGYTITDIRSTDRMAYVTHFREKEIYDNTLHIPFPYTEADADAWLERVAEETARNGRPVSWAIRGPDNALIGGIGFGGLELGKTHRGEVGYWLAKAYWGRGIMTTALQNICGLAFTDLGLIRVTAHVLVFNLRSERVLHKAGFNLEGLLRMHHFKDGRYLDGKLYARLKEEPMGMPP